MSLCVCVRESIILCGVFRKKLHFHAVQLSGSQVLQWTLSVCSCSYITMMPRMRQALVEFEKVEEALACVQSCQVWRLPFIVLSRSL